MTGPGSSASTASLPLHGDVARVQVLQRLALDELLRLRRVLQIRVPERQRSRLDGAEDVPLAQVFALARVGAAADALLHDHRIAVDVAGLDRDVARRSDLDVLDVE